MEGDEENDGPRFSFVGLLKDLLAIFSRKLKREQKKKKRVEKKKKTARTTEILQARRSHFIPLPPDNRK